MTAINMIIGCELPIGNNSLSQELMIEIIIHSTLLQPTMNLYLVFKAYYSFTEQSKFL